MIFPSQKLVVTQLSNYPQILKILHFRLTTIAITDSQKETQEKCTGKEETSGLNLRKLICKVGKIVPIT